MATDLMVQSVFRNLMPVLAIIQQNTECRECGTIVAARR